MRSRSARVRVVSGVAGALLAGSAGHAAANWNVATQGIEATYTAAVLAPVTDLTATGRCRLLKPSVDLSWTATTSPQVTGYRVLRRTGSGSYTTVATLSGRATSTYNDTAVTTSATYTYLVKAVRNNWYADSSTATATTPTVCT